ncbi:MAG: amidohydrolase [Balneola sp.]|nr:amidohydrolase [Balneola sp.]MBO6649411.1 amidohydrolase [Balneola sp.]MBO6711226.1 amidohydrolase [Balneola sp.]MBO6800659.1 amidohydrolase [Balneola sp.]MBO6869162.1 amidohydrolase [Balneola sp.]
MKYTQILLITIATIILACSPKKDTTLIENVNGYTIIGEDLVEFKSVAIKNGKFLEISSVSLAERYPNSQIIDGEGKTLLPGLIDAHGHVMGLGFQQLNVNLMGINSLEATLDTLKNYAEANPDLEWIQGRGWNQTLWEENEFPTAEDIDKVISDRPVWLSRVDGHAGWGNSMALRMAGISKDTPDPQGGKVIRDGSGKATGVFIDAAQGFVESEIPAPTEKEQKLALEKAYAQMAKMGITSVHDAGVGVKAWNLYKEFADQRKAKTRIYGMISGSGKTFDELSKNGPVDSYSDDMLALRSVKLYSDGALGSRGAAMLQPYSDDPGNFGLLFMDQEEMDAAVSKVVGKGFQANIHAIGDAGNRQVLDALEKAQNEHGDQGLRNRVEHAQIVALDDIPRFKELDIIASMQPTHATSDMNMAEDRVGPQRIKGGYAWKTFLEQGTKVAAGSDFPVEHSNPFFGLYSAVTRMDHSGNPEGGWYPNESLTREEALRAFTLDAAYAGHQEDVLGSIEEGKWADFILIDQDYFSIPASDIWEIKVLETWVAGEKVYSADK